MDNQYSPPQLQKILLNEKEITRFFQLIKIYQLLTNTQDWFCADLSLRQTKETFKLVRFTKKIMLLL